MEWLKELSREDNSEEFSQLCHDYYKLATMRVMQVMRDKYKVPPEEIPTLTMAIFARMMNESVYSVGANIKPTYGIDSFYDKKHLLNLINVLNGEPLDSYARDDIETDIQKGIAKFREFIINYAPDFYV